jgi:hypothetical protein
VGFHVRWVVILCFQLVWSQVVQEVPCLLLGTSTSDFAMSISPAPQPESIPQLACDRVGPEAASSWESV